MHPKLLGFRTKLFRYRFVEQKLVSALSGKRMLDVGCGDGENLLRFEGLPVCRYGLEISFPRLRRAHGRGLNVLQASGTNIPFPPGSFDLIYIAHVLHHVAGYQRVLAEINRCLVAQGHLFVVETTTDHPLLRLGRKIHPCWRGDQVEASWRYADLTSILENAGYEIVESGRYNLIFFLWEMLPLAFWPFEIFTPVFVYLDLFLARFFKKYSAHCYFVLRKKHEEQTIP